MRQRIRKGLLAFSALMFPLTFFFLSPFVIVAAASQGIVNGSAIIFGLLLLAAIFFSRLFCGWLCPGGAVQDAVARANNRHWNSKGKNLSKYIIWVIWFGFIVFLWGRSTMLHADFLYMLDFDTLYIMIYAIVMSVIFIFTLITGQRGMCHSLCWIVPFMVLGEKLADLLHIPRFRLRAKPDACISCGICTKSCPMGITIGEKVKMGNVESTECINCLECVDVCPKKAIGCGVAQKVIKRGE